MNTHSKTLKIGCSKCKVLYSIPLPDPNGSRVPHTLISSNFVIKDNKVICHSCYYGISMEQFIHNENDEVYNEVERIAKEEKIMETHYGVESFPEDEPYFTTSQETDIREMISDGLFKDEIIDRIKKW